jgi:hypothetical protein
MTCGTKNGMPHLHPPLKAIRRKCLDCCCGSSHEVDLCQVEDCSLYPYRFGKSPTRKGRRLTDEERAAVAERFARARALKSQDSNSDKR